MRDIKEVLVYSEKYNITGKIVDAHNRVSKLVFEYEDKVAEIGLELNFSNDKGCEEKAIALMEACIEQHEQSGSNERKIKLYYWYLKSATENGEEFIYLKGHVSGHPRFMDSMSISTSMIKQMGVDWENGEFIAQTMNSVYHCPLEYANFKKLEERKELLPEYDRIKAEYEGKIEYPQIEPGKVLLVIANFADYYFHSLYYVKEEGGEPEEYSGWPHVGMFQDSYLIETENYDIDLRYFPHHQNIEFYSEDTNDCPWYIENIGDIELYCQTSIGLIKLEPGERKEVCEENISKDEPTLAGGDLYPAGICF